METWAEVAEVQRKNRLARKRAWDTAKEATRKNLIQWMEEHPGEVPDPDTLRLCSEAVFDSVRIVLEEQDGAALDREPLLGQAAGVVRKVCKELRKTISFRKQRTDKEWSAIFPRYPMICFDPSDGDGMRAAMEKYGMFVVRVMTEQQCDETIAAMFEEVNTQRKEAEITGPEVSPNDPESWADENWPAKSKFLLSRPALHPIAFRNRCLESIRMVFSALFGGEERLHSTVDNWGIARGGTVNAKWSKGGLKPHWDINPWCILRHTHAGEDPGYQGLVALMNQTEETGCHLTLPGGVKFLEEWVKENPTGTKHLTRCSRRPDPDDPIVRWMQPIPLRRGEMIVWSWGQLHGSTNSRSEEMRLHQYIRMYPAPEAGMSYDYSCHDRYSCVLILQRCLRSGLLTEGDINHALPDERSRCILGLSLYPDNDE